MVTRRLDPALPTMAIAFMSIVALTLVGGMAGLTEQWRAMAARELAYLALAACFFSLAVYLAVRAFRSADISVVAPFRYTFLLWAGIAGYVFFNELPDRLVGVRRGADRRQRPLHLAPGSAAAARGGADKLRPFARAFRPSFD